MRKKNFENSTHLSTGVITMWLELCIGYLEPEIQQHQVQTLQIAQENKNEASMELYDFWSL